MFPIVDHPTAGPHRVTRTLFAMSETPGTVAAGAPLHGMHTARALMDLLGLDREAVDDLAARSVVPGFVLK
jgi:crotonobetainyl-CoA:carnitine CoA-transferase CaiB-like acyl-CoA transferase